MSIDIDERTLDRIAQRSANAILSCWATNKGGLKAVIVREVKAAIYLDRAATQPAPVPAQTAERLILDAECAQSKCARKTTGCWGECDIKRNSIVYSTSTNIVAVYAVATQPAPQAHDCGNPRCKGCFTADEVAAALAQPAPIPAQTETQQASCNSALHAEPAGQREANVSALLDIEIIQVMGAVGLSRGNITDFITFARAIEEKLATRCRAEGGNTCNEGSSLLAGNALTDEAKDAVVDAANKLIKAKGRYHTEKSYKVLAETLARAVLASHIKAGQDGKEQG